jgi:hypothetical protein
VCAFSCIPRPGDGLEELVSLTLYLNQIAVVAMSTIFFKKKRKKKKEFHTGTWKSVQIMIVPAENLYIRYVIRYLIMTVTANI